MRSEPSAADSLLIDWLQGRGHQVSLAQLERWRAAGVLPRNPRVYAGRGSGSSSTVPEDAFAMAEVLALSAKPGRSVHESVLRMFAVDPRHDDLFDPLTPPLPEEALRAAFSWFVETGDQSLDRRIERTIRRRGAKGDEAAEIASQFIARHYRLLRAHPPPEVRHRSAFWDAPTAAETLVEATHQALRFDDDDYLSANTR